jgi:transposase
MLSVTRTEARMDRFVGLDVHAASTTVAIIGPSGRKLGTRVVETNGRVLVEAMRLIAGNCHVCLEEGIQAEWVYETLKPHVTEIVVAKVDKRRQPKNDERDAFGLAERMRTHAVGTPVFKDTGPMAALRELVRLHARVVGDVVRSKNRLKTLFRARGIETTGKQVYGAAERAAWLKKLPIAKRAAADVIYAELDALEPLRAKLEEDVVRESRRFPIAAKLQTCPGLGPIRVAVLLATVVSPMRFRSKRQFWSYCGLAVVTRSSSDWMLDEKHGWQRTTVPLTRGLSRSCNRPLKEVFKGAATTVSLQPNSPLGQHYARLVKGGTKASLAKLTIARRIAAIALALWKHNEEYDPTKQARQD